MFRFKTKVVSTEFVFYVAVYREQQQKCQKTEKLIINIILKAFYSLNHSCPEMLKNFVRCFYQTKYTCMISHTILISHRNHEYRRIKNGLICGPAGSSSG